MTESLSTYAVEAGTVLVYIATKKGNETGRRYFLTEMEPGEQIPSMLHEEMGEQWVLVFSAMGEAVVAEIPGIDESVIRTFAKKISLVLLDVERFGEEMVEMVNMKLITEEGFVYAVSEEQEKTREKGLTLIYNMFHKKTRSSQADKSGNALYDTLAFICGQKRMKIASYDSMKEACGRRFGVDDIARVSHFAARKVLLEEEWFRNDSGILLVFRADKKIPCAAVPKGAGRYELHDCVKGTSVRLTEKAARTLSPEAYMIYRPFPNQALSVMDLVKFSIPAVKKSDLANLFLMAAVSALIGLLLPFMNQKIFDEYIPMGDRATLLQISVLILSFTVGNLLFTMIKNIAVFRFTNACEYEVQAAVFDRLYNLPSSFFNDYDSGDLGQRAMGISAIFNLMSDVAVNVVLTASFSLFYVVRMFGYSGTLSRIGLFLILVNASITGIIGYTQIRYEKELMEVKAKVSSLMYQILSGISKIKIAGVENRALLQYLEPYTESKKIMIKKARLDNISENVNLLLNTMFTVVFYYLMITKDLGISFGKYMAFTSAFGYFSNAVISMVSAFLEVNHAIPTYKRAKPILESVPEYDDSTVIPGKLNGNIEVNNVSFKYSEGGENIITDLSFRIRKGEYIGIVGSSGSGKSTLLKLLLGFEKPTQGKIYYDDKDIDSLDKRELRKKFGVVLQDGQMISGSIYENIMITSGDVSEKRVKQIIQMVGLEQDIAQMPMGIHTVISEGSGTISGGQRQRILIARAIANNPRILYFDEATSALDNVNQALVCQSLEKLHATRVVIAHRLSTVMNCDRIFVLEQGRLIEQGNYEELMALGGRFYELASRQMV